MGNGDKDVAEAGTGKARVEPTAPVNDRVYQDRRDFSNSLDSALGQQGCKDNAVLQQIEGGATPLQIVSDQDRKVVSSVEQGGRVVREHMSCGPDVVVAYDDKGQAHRFPDNKITKIPPDFSTIPDWRQKQFTGMADELLKNYTSGKMPNGFPDRMLSFNDISCVMKDISKMDGLTELEKCRLWSEVRMEMQNKSVPLLDRDEKEEMIDSWKGSDDPWHALIHFSDGYHGDRLINMSPADASKAIQAHENGAEADSMPFVRGLVWKTAKAVLGVNTGDVNASEGQLKALRELRSKGTFSAYADEWTKQFVRADRDQYGRPR